MITISPDQLKELEAYIGTIPTSYGLPLIQFFIKLSSEQNPPVEEAKEV